MATATTEAPQETMTAERWFDGGGQIEELNRITALKDGASGGSSDHFAQQGKLHIGMAIEALRLLGDIPTLPEIYECLTSPPRLLLHMGRLRILDTPAGVGFSYTITASNSPTSFSASGLPGGLSINTSTGVISGTPTATGSSTVTLGAANAGGSATPVTLSLTVNSITAPVITSGLTATGLHGVAFSYTVTASNSPTSYSASGLPAGLSINTSTGVISGTPSSSSSSTVSATISATNLGGTGSATLIFTMNPPAPVISSSTTASANVGSAFSYTITASNSPTSFSASGLGPQWNGSWISYISGGPTGGQADAIYHAPDGSDYTYGDYRQTPAQGAGATIINQGDFQQNEGWTHATLHYRQNPERYERWLPDGTTEVYSQPAGTLSTSRLFFLTLVSDPQGNTTTLTYDPIAAANGQAVLTSVTDPQGGQLIFSYNTANPLLIAKVTRSTDGLSARFEYTQGQLSSITDTNGIASSFGYASGTAFVNKMTTPYGTSTFNSSDGTGSLEADMTNPLGQTERVEYQENLSTSLFPATESSVPSASGLTVDNTNLNHANTFYWDRREYSDGGTVDSSGFYAKAEVTHWAQSGLGSIPVPLSTKRPLEGRVWYNYPGQSSVDYVLTEAAGASTSPSVTARVLDGGATQAGYSTYNANGMITQSVDPLGRTTNYSYNSNGVDLYQVTQANGSSQDVLKTLTNYNSQHEPQTIVDAAGQAMTLTYNSAGQVTSSTVNVSGSNQTTTLSYTGPGGSGAGNYLTTVTGPISGATTSYTYDSDERVQAVTDSEGYTLTYGYDNLDRQTSVTYPDSTTDLTYYRNLDVDHTVDRQKRTIWNQYDAIHELLQTTDPLGRTTKYTWCLCGGLSTLTDPNGNVTTWGLDTQGRVTSKTYADSTSISYVYETNESRLHAMTDARENVVTDSYNTDDTLSGISYTPGSGVAPTPNVHFGYDPVYNRVTSMTDGTGTTTRTYNPVNGVVGAGQLASVSMPIAGSLATSTFTYDKLGRIVTRDVDHAKTNANNSSTTYDVLGRVTNVSNALGAFTYTYVDETSRLSGVTYPSGTGLSTSYSYFGNTGNQRLQEIKNMQGTTQLSKFNYTYNPVGTIATWTTQADSNTAIVNTLTYDAADQLITGVQSGGGSASNAYSYDPAGNRLTETTTTGTTTGNCNKLNQLMSLTSSSTIQTISGYTSAAVTNVTVNAVPASIGNSTNFSASVPLTPGSTNMISVVAQPSSSSGTTTTQRWNVVTSGTAPATQLVYDANGNVTTDENGNNYQWDALNRLTAIIYHSGANAGNHTEFAYNGLGQRTQIVEKTGVTVGSGTVISTENYLWIGSEITEVRNASNAVTKRFFPQGEQQSSTNYYYTRDHLRSVREMCGSSGTIVARYSYDPFGNTILLSGTNLATRQFAGMFLHNVSQDYQTWGRIYDQNAGRWLSRDPLGEQKGVNLYNYVQNAPIDAIDPVGLCGMFVVRPATVDTGTQTDPLKGNVVGGRGYQVEYQNTGCCAGSIKLVQSINSYWTPLQIDGKPLPAADGLPDMTTQSKQAVPGKSFVDSPGNQDLDTYTLEVCAVCRHQDGYECEVGCVTFQWYASTGKILSGGGASEAQLPGDQYTKAKKKYRPAP